MPEVIIVLSLRVLIWQTSHVDNNRVMRHLIIKLEGKIGGSKGINLTTFAHYTFLIKNHCVRERVKARKPVSKTKRYLQKNCSFSNEELHCPQTGEDLRDH